jgi:hypothetical protein
LLVQGVKWRPCATTILAVMSMSGPPKKMN